MHIGVFAGPAPTQALGAPCMGRRPMFPPHISRVVFSILLPTITGLGLVALTYTYSFSWFAWQPAPHPKWGMVICGIGLLIIILFIVALIDSRANWVELALLGVAGLLVFVVGWSLEPVLLLVPYLLAGLLYLASFVLVGFGAWQAITTQYEETKEHPTDKQGRVQGHTEAYKQGRIEGYAEGQAAGRTKGYAEGYTQAHTEVYIRRYDEGYAAGYAKGYAEGRADNPVREKEGSISFDPWPVLGISPGSTKAAIRKAYRDQMGLYHPDKVAHLGKDLREAAERMTKDINRAYDMLRRR